MINMNLIYCKISEFSDEKIAVAGIFYDLNQIHIHISNERLRIIKSIIGQSKFQLISQFSNALRNNYKKYHNSLTLFDSSSLQKEIELTKYLTNNSIYIESHITFNLDFNNDNLNKLLKIYFQNSGIENEKRSKTDIQIVKEHFKKSVKNIFTLKYTFHKKDFTNSLFPTPVGFAGKNGSVVTGDFVSSKRENEFILIKVSSLINLAKYLKDIFMNQDLYELSLNTPEITLVESTNSNVENIIVSARNSGCKPLIDTFNLSVN